MLWFALAYGVALVVQVGLDFGWLNLAGGPIYQSALGAVLAERPNMTAAVVFYLMYAVAVVLFAVRPALAAGNWRVALLWGGLFGFFAYATYDLTNLATLKVWSVKVSVIDIAWGTVVTAVSAGASAWMTLALKPPA